jgi:large subunit ribosomal protein L10
MINELMLGELTAHVEKASCLVLIDSSKLNSEDAIKFRTNLRKVGAKLKVTKASILYRILPAGADKIVPQRGPVGVIRTGEDIASAAKLVNELAKEEKIALKGGFLESKVLSSKDAAKLADLPTREQAAALVIRTLNAPLVQLVRIANTKPTELVRVLKVASEPKA